MADTVQIGTRIVFLNLVDGMDGADGLSKVTTSDGVSIWDNSDLVHLTRSAYNDFALAVVLVGNNNDSKARPRKQQRLESCFPQFPGDTRG